MRPGLAVRWARSWGEHAAHGRPHRTRALGVLVEHGADEVRLVRGQAGNRHGRYCVPGFVAAAGGKGVSTAPLASFSMSPPAGHAWPMFSQSAPLVAQRPMLVQVVPSPGSSGCWDPRRRAPQSVRRRRGRPGGACNRRYRPSSSRNRCRSCRSALCHPGRTAARTPPRRPGIRANDDSALCAASHLLPMPARSFIEAEASTRIIRSSGTISARWASWRRFGWKRRHPSQRSFRRRRPRPAAQRSPHRCHRPVRPRHPPRYRRSPVPGRRHLGWVTAGGEGQEQAGRPGRVPMTLMNGLHG